MYYVAILQVRFPAPLSQHSAIVNRNRQLASEIWLWRTSGLSSDEGNPTPTFECQLKIFNTSLYEYAFLFYW